MPKWCMDTVVMSRSGHLLLSRGGCVYTVTDTKISILPILRTPFVDQFKRQLGIIGPVSVWLLLCCYHLFIFLYLFILLLCSWPVVCTTRALQYTPWPLVSSHLQLFWCFGGWTQEQHHLEQLQTANCVGGLFATVAKPQTYLKTKKKTRKRTRSRSKEERRKRRRGNQDPDRRHCSERQRISRYIQ